MSHTTSHTPTVAFIACNKNGAKFRQDASFFYRCENPAVVLQQQGISTALLHCQDTNARSLRPDLAIFHRPAFRGWGQARGLRKLITHYRRHGTTVIADFDDLVFDPNYAEFSPGVINHLVSLQQTQKNFLQHKKTLALFDRFSVSTEPLKQHLVDLGIPQTAIAVAHNAPPISWSSIVPTATSNSEHFNVCYFPGTRSHDRDFAEVITPLKAFLADHPEATLSVTGTLNVEDVKCHLGSLQAQFSYSEKVPITQYVNALNSGDLHIAPLQNTPFNQCKSALKALEGNYFNRPVIATPIPDIERLPKPGITLASETAHWYDALVAHYKNRQNGNFRELVNKNYNAENQAQLLLQP